MMMFISMTRKELLRKRVFLVALVLTVLFLCLYGYGIHQIASSTVDDSVDLLRRYAYGLLFLSVGLFFANMVVAFVVFFSSMGTISGEVENGLMFAILPRPIARWKIYLGKWIGFSVWSLLYSAFIFVAILWIVHWQLGFPIDLLSVGKAFLLFEMIPLVLLAVSFLGSTFLPTLGNGVASALLFGFGLFGGMLERISFLESHKIHSGIEQFGLLTSLLLPADALYRRMTYELMGDMNIPLGGEAINILGPFSNPVVPSVAFVCYSLVYIIILLLLGCRIFSRKDI